MLKYLMSNLSEKEIIQECEDLANNNYNELGDCWDVEYSRNAISGLLDLYMQENKRCHFLQSELDQANARIIEYQKQLDLDYVEENYISKDKIREKLKIRKEEKAECTDSIEAQYLLREIYVLEELLEGY